MTHRQGEGPPRRAPGVARLDRGERSAVIAPGRRIKSLRASLCLGVSPKVGAPAWG